MKTITIEDETWAKLTELKVKQRMETLDDVLKKLLENEPTDWYQHFYDEAKKG